MIWLRWNCENGLFPSQASSALNTLIGFGVTALVIVLVRRDRLCYQPDQE